MFELLSSIVNGVSGRLTRIFVNNLWVGFCSCRFASGSFPWVIRKRTTVSKQELGFMRRIMTTEATTTERLGIGAVTISNEKKMKKERSCEMWRIIVYDLLKIS